MGPVHADYVARVFGFVLFTLAALGFPSPTPPLPYPQRWNLIAGGLACWIGSTLF